MREAGALRSLEGLVSAACGGTDWQVAWRREEGAREYRGLTNLGRQVESKSDIVSDEVEVSASWPFLILSRNGVTAGVGVALRRTSRDLNSVGNIRGYPETLTTATPLVSVKLAWRPGNSWVMDTALRVGIGLPGRLKVDLPRADPADLRTGLGSSWQIRQRVLRSSLSPHGQVWLEVLAGATSTRAGEAAPIYRNGVVVGSVSQPMVRTSTAGASLGITW